MALALGSDVAKQTCIAALWREGRGQALGDFASTPDGFAAPRQRLAAVAPAPRAHERGRRLVRPARRQVRARAASQDGPPGRARAGARRRRALPARAGAVCHRQQPFAATGEEQPAALAA